MVTALTSTKATAARFTTGPVVFLALFLLLAQTGRVASYPGELVFEEDEEKKCSAPEPHCVTVAQCPQAQRDIRRGRHPTICDWKGATSLVCCAQPTALPPVTPNQPYPPTEVPSPNPPVEPPVGPPVEPPLEPPIQPPTVVPPVVPPEPQPKPPTDQGTGTTTEQGASGTRGPSSDGNAGSSGTKPDGTSEGREPTAADEDCECDDALPVRTCGLRPEATESRQRPARLLLDEPVYSLDARRVRRPGLSRRRPLNAVSLLPRQQLTGQSQQQQQRQQQQSSSSDSTWPWMASVVDQVNPARRCAGVLLDQQHVLTAAQCFGPDNGRNSAVMLNTPGLPVTLRHVVSVEAHPMFRVPDGYHDLALVRFEPALASGELAPICLPTVLNARRVLNGSVLDAVSWSNRQRDFHPGSMGEKRYQVISASSCNNTYAGVDLSPYPQGINHDDFICTQLTTNVGEECVGIPGSPLMVKDGSHWTVIGLYSFGVSCSGTAQYPTVFTRVSPYVTWIYERLGLRR